jgi:hypothetical protein
MTITVHSTTKIVHVNGVPCRIWEGQSAKGVTVRCFIALVAADCYTDVEEFKKDLEEHQPPTADVESYPDKIYRNLEHN